MAIVDDLLAQRLADALRQSAVDLPLHNHRVDQHAAIVNGVKGSQGNRAGLRIHDDHGKMHGLRIVGIRRIVKLRDFQSGRVSRRQQRALISDVRDRGELDRAIGAAHFE